MKNGSIFKYLAFLLLFITSLSSLAQDEELNKFNDGLKYVELSYKGISDQFDKKELSNDSLKASIDVLIIDRDSLFAISTALNKKLNQLTISLTELGPIPEEGAPLEAENVTTKRARLNKQITQLNGYLSNANDLLDAIEKLGTDISDYRNSLFLSGITARTASPFSKNLWTNGWEEYRALKKSTNDYYDSFWKAFWDDKKWDNIFLMFLSALLAMVVIVFPFSAFGKRISSTLKITSQNPNLEKRLKLVVPPGIKSIIILMALGILYLAAVEIKLINPEMAGMVKRMILWTTLAVFIWDFAKTLFAPNVLMFNRIICTQGREQGNRLLFVGMIYVYITDNVLINLFDIIGAGMNLVIIQSIIITSIYAVLLFIFFAPKRWLFTTKGSDDIQTDSATSKSTTTAEKAAHHKKLVINEIVFFIGRVIAIAILLAISLEYVRMANFVFHRLVMLTLFYLLFTSVRTLSHWAILGLTKHKQVAGKKSFNAVDDRTSLDFWLNTAVDIMLIILSAPAFLFALGIDWIDINNWIQLFFTGFKIGGITISFKNIFDGVFTFLLIIVAVRWTTSIINKRLKENTNLNDGVRNSLITLLNYAGVVIALFTAIPMLGFNFSNITVVAGALSVGIGFGLQNIVKDFVSGLILLIDRPVKIGDWVVLTSGQGYVKEIKSRVTIIQTFDRSNIIVPNSDLVTLPVQNWFYGNKQGRVRVKVHVDHSSDPEQVREVLLQCAKDHHSILASPKPSVIWEGFGDSSFNFELRSYISNSDNAYLVRSDLHFSIHKALKDAGITIPFPQRDLHIKEAAAIPPK